MLKILQAMLQQYISQELPDVQAGFIQGREARDQIANIPYVIVSCVQLFVSPWTTITCQTPLSMGFSRQEYWSGLPCPSSGDLPDP